MKKIVLSLLLISLIITFSHAQQIDTLIAKYYGKPVIKMTLNGKKTWVLLDTGSEITVLNTRSKDKFEFNIFEDYEPLQVSGFGSDRTILVILLIRSGLGQAKLSRQLSELM